jgi:16S rRNA (cytosine1402-N4)-methyltransferase
MHTPVLLQPAIEGLNVKKGGRYIDATVGEGGHLAEILKKGGKVLGLDADQKQIQNLKVKAQIFEQARLVCGNYANIKKIAEENDFIPVDGVLFDLGLSMNQINQSGRGFSYHRIEEDLDMRLDIDQEKTAADIVNKASEEELYEILTANSEELKSRPISQAIVRHRRVQKIVKVVDLLKIIDQVVIENRHKTYARVFQALRIAVNSEFTNLKKGLTGAFEILRPEGRLVVISFHSLEDRLVKQFVVSQGLVQVNKKVFVKGGAKFERSAKIRIISKKT